MDYVFINLENGQLTSNISRAANAIVVELEDIHRAFCKGSDVCYTARIVWEEDEQFMRDCKRDKEEGFYDDIEE